METIIVAVSLIGLSILLPICHYWVFIDKKGWKDED